MKAASTNESDQINIPATVSIRFVTTIPLLHNKLPSSSFDVPVSIGRYGLSELVNHLLDHSKEENRPFDFVINQLLLRQNLQKFITRHSLSFESTLTVTVCEAAPPPNTSESSTHPDWISSISAIHPQFAISGCYDGILRSINSAGEIKSVTTAHSSAIKCMSGAIINDSYRIVSSGKDRKVCVWNIANDKTPTCSFVANADSESSVECIAYLPLPASSRFTTGQFDCSIILWAIDESKVDKQMENDNPKLKRRKQNFSEESAESPLKNILSYTTHSDAVTDLSYPFDTTVFSASLDKQFIQYDLSKQNAVRSTVTPQSILSLSLNQLGTTLLTSHTDKQIRQWDIRQNSTKPTEIFVSHTQMVSKVSWSPHREEQFISCSYDHSVKLWDIRSTIPLQTFTNHTQPILTVQWSDQSNSVLSGGKDSIIRRIDWPSSSD